MKTPPPGWSTDWDFNLIFFLGDNRRCPISRADRLFDETPDNDLWRGKRVNAAEWAFADGGSRRRPRDTMCPRAGIIYRIHSSTNIATF